MAHVQLGVSNKPQVHCCKAVLQLISSIIYWCLGFFFPSDADIIVRISRRLTSFCLEYQQTLHNISQLICNICTHRVLIYRYIYIHTYRDVCILHIPLRCICTELYDVCVYPYKHPIYMCVYICICCLSYRKHPKHCLVFPFCQIAKS